MLRDFRGKYSPSIFTSMTKRIKHLSILIALSLAGILCLQGYLLYQDFQTKKVEYLQDVNSILELTAEDMNDLRRTKISELYRKDLLDTNITRLEYDLDREEGPQISMIDVLTNSKELSLRISADNIHPDSLTREYLFNRLYESLFGFRNGGLIAYSVGSAIGERAMSYRDTLAIDLGEFKRRLDERLGSRSITTNYKTVVLHRDSSFVAPSEQTIVSKRYNFEHKGTKNQVLLYFDNPTFNILQRSTLILFTCLVVFIITVWSFYRLIQTIRKQRRISEIKDDFIDGMTHELLTPISTLKIALESLEKMDNLTNTTRSKEYFDVSGQALDRINDIVQNVLYSSLHDGGDVKLEFEKINLNDLLEGLIDYHKNRTEGDLELSLQKLENPWITSDRQHLTNVIHNLLDNAIKYSDSKPVKVSVVAKRFANEVSIVVNDNGIGIPENEQNKIFEKFYRGNHFQKNINGLGIGLYYVKNILNRLNGRIELLSSSQLGSTFRVSLNTNKTDHG